MNLSFRKYNFNIHKQEDQLFVFDEVRKKNVIITPEEWVRQNLLHYFYEDLAYPKSKIAIEKEFILNGRKKRFDMLVFDRDMNPSVVLDKGRRLKHGRTLGAVIKNEDGSERSIPDVRFSLLSPKRRSI